MGKDKFYTLSAIKQYNADYNVIYGERSNGKTTAVLGEGLDDHINSGYVNQIAIIRRWEEDIKGSNAEEIFKGIRELGWVREKTNCKYNSIKYKARRWYLVKVNNEGDIVEEAKEPFALAFAISLEEHYKSTSYPNVTTILFDEFITRNTYLPDEFVKFQNLLSTIIRLRTNVKIYMCGNTINRHCPYFAEMGLTNVRQQKRGTIDLYTYGEGELRVAVEYSDFPAKKKPSNKYFAFNNPKLEMITTGGWELSIHPHLPCKYKPKDVIHHFYIEFDREMMQANIIEVNDMCFLYIHRKTTPIREDNEQLVYTQKPDARSNYRNSIYKPTSKLEMFVLDLIKNWKVFYQDNEVGELFNNYLKWCIREGR